MHPDARIFIHVTHALNAPTATQFEFLAAGEWRRVESSHWTDSGSVHITCTDGTHWISQSDARRWFRPIPSTPTTPKDPE